jgi:FtsZ-interacting cell division protein YlmF
MGLFGKKNQINEYTEAQNEMNKEIKSKASERIYFDEISGDDQRTLFYVETMRNHQPLVLNFEGVSVAVANKVLAFLAGAVYVLKGKTVKIDEKIYLFALSEDFLDGSLDAFIRELR